MLESNAVIILYFLIFTFPVWASLYHNFKIFTGNKNANWLLHPYDTEKEFIIIFFYVCWFEIAATRTLNFRVTFFLYLIYKGWLKAEQHLNGEFFLQCISQRQGTISGTNDNKESPYSLLTNDWHEVLWNVREKIEQKCENASWIPQHFPAVSLGHFKTYLGKRLCIIITAMISTVFHII